MDVLIVEANETLGVIWKSHLERTGFNTQLVLSDDVAFNAIRFVRAQVIILDLISPQINALAIADYTTFRAHRSRVIFVSSNGFCWTG